MDAFTVIGAGGIGCAVGYALRASGLPVTFVDADADKVSWGRQHGVAVHRRPALPADFVAFGEWSPPSDAIVLLCTKCYDNATVLARLPESVTVLPIQNGFDPALDAYGHAAEGIASFVSECLTGRCHTRITRLGRLHLGPRGGRLEPRLRRWAEAMHSAGLFTVDLVDDILPYKHTKLMYNAAISPLAASAGLDNGQLLSVPLARRLFFALLRENYGILSGAGVALGTIGPLAPATVARILSRPWLAHGLAWAFYPSLRGTYCSMSGDLPRGRTEMANYNGHLIRLAGDRPCPLNRAVFDLVNRMALNAERPRIDVLEELVPFFDKVVWRAA